MAFPSILNFFSGANFFACIFFLMAVFLGVDSAFGWVDYYAHYFIQTIPALQKYSHQVVLGGLLVSSFIFGLMFCAEGGLYQFNAFDDYVSSCQLLALLFIQSIFVPYVVGCDKFSELIYIRTRSRIRF